jgi:hypothetical protein
MPSALTIGNYEFFWVMSIAVVGVGLVWGIISAFRK